MSQCAVCIFSKISELDWKWLTLYLNRNVFSRSLEIFNLGCLGSIPFRAGDLFENQNVGIKNLCVIVLHKNENIRVLSRKNEEKGKILNTKYGFGEWGNPY